VVTALSPPIAARRAPRIEIAAFADTQPVRASLVAAVMPRPAATPPIVMQQAATAPASAIVAQPALPARRRAPAWRPPTRWARPQQRRSLAPFLLLALIGFAAWLVYAGWIDLDRWREIIAEYTG